MDSLKKLQLKIREARAEYILTERQKVDKEGKRQTFQKIGERIGITRQQAFEILDSYFKGLGSDD